MAKRYTGTWESINQHEVPEWYEDCKFGIFIHWGIYSVPAYAPRTWELGAVPTNEEWFCNNPYAEWYYNSINVGRGPSYDHHIEKYGKDFKYEDFIPMWKAENWDPKQCVGQRIEGDANDKLFFRPLKNRPRSLGANGRLTAIIRHIIGEY